MEGHTHGGDIYIERYIKKETYIRGGIYMDKYTYKGKHGRGKQIHGKTHIQRDTQTERHTQKIQGGHTYGRDIHMEGYIHKKVHIRRNINTGGTCTYERTYTRKKGRKGVRRDIYMDKHTHGGI